MSDLPTEEMSAAILHAAESVDDFLTTFFDWDLTPDDQRKMSEGVHRAIANAMEAVEPDGWEPIETIPQRLKKQRFEIIGHDARTGTSHVTYWTEYDWYDPDQHYYSEAPEFKPTHWLLLPPTPSPEGV
jgi:hypothetical protein